MQKLQLYVAKLNQFLLGTCTCLQCISIPSVIQTLCAYWPYALTSVVFEEGCKRTAKSFDLLKIRVKSLKIRAKSLENPNKIPKYLRKIPENRCKNDAQRCLTSKNGAQALQKNKWRPFSGGHATKTVGNTLCPGKSIQRSCLEMQVSKCYFRGLYGDKFTSCGECMITLSLPRSGACNLAILNCAPVFAPRLLGCACGLVMQYCKVFF